MCVFKVKTLIHVRIDRSKVKTNIDLESNLICCKNIDDKLWLSSDLLEVVSVTVIAFYRCSF